MLLRIILKKCNLSKDCLDYKKTKLKKINKKKNNDSEDANIFLAEKISLHQLFISYQLSGDFLYLILNIYIYIYIYIYTEE